MLKLHSTGLGCLFLYRRDDSVPFRLSIRLLFPWAKRVAWILHRISRPLALFSGQHVEISVPLPTACLRNSEQIEKVGKTQEKQIPLCCFMEHGSGALCPVHNTPRVIQGLFSHTCP